MKIATAFTAILCCTMFLTSCRGQEPQIVQQEYSTQYDTALQKCFPALREGEKIVYHKGYALVYNERHEQASWVAYMLTRQRVGGNWKRSNDFREDTDIETQSAQLYDYKPTSHTYARGHLAPAADMKWDSVAMSESFLLSNMSPQLHAFNDGLWNTLENKVRDWAKTFDTIYVITGPVLRDDDSISIGIDSVTVPTAYYKVVYCPATHQGMALFVPHEQQSVKWYDLAITIDKLEEITGIDFLNAIPCQDEIESNICTYCWNGKKNKHRK